MFEKPTYIREYDEFLQNTEKIKRRRDIMEHTVALRDLVEILETTRKLADELTNASSLEEMFRRDAIKIRDAYLNGEISKAKAEELLNNLEKFAENLREHYAKVNDTLYNYEMLSHAFEERYREVQVLWKNILKKLHQIHALSYPPEHGIPLDNVIDSIKRRIREIKGTGLPKREFGVVELLSDNNIKDRVLQFLDEYSTGVIITKSSLKDDILKLLEEKRVTAKEEEAGNRILLIIR